MSSANNPILEPKDNVKLKPQNILSPKPKSDFEIKEDEELVLQKQELLKSKEHLKIVNIIFSIGHPDIKSDETQDELYKITYYEDGSKIVEDLGELLSEDEFLNEDLISKEKKTENQLLKEKNEIDFKPLIIQEGFNIRQRVQLLNKKLHDYFGRKTSGGFISEEEEVSINKEINKINLK